MGAIATLIVVIGIVVVIYGFMERAKAQRVTKAPLVKTGQVMSHASGTAVSVEGNVVCPQPLIAPFSGTRCLYYSIKCTAEWKVGETKKTKELSSNRMAAQFSIDDGSGPAPIDAAQGGTFEPTQKKSETKGAGLLGGLTGKDLTFGQYVVSTGALEVGTQYRVEEEVMPLQPRLYACGAVAGVAIGAPSGMRSLILSNKSRDALLGSALKTSKLALAGGFGGIAVGTILGIVSRILAPADAAAPEATASATATAAAEPAPTAVAAAVPAAASPEPAQEPHTTLHKAREVTQHPEVKPVATESAFVPAKPKVVPAVAPKPVPASTTKPK